VSDVDARPGTEGGLRVPTWSTQLDPGGPIVELRAVDPVADLDLVHQWMVQPHVSPWWALDGPADEVGRYLDAQCRATHLTPWIVSVDGEPVAYTETYDVAGDPLADHHAFADGDRGWHVLVGDPAHLGTGVTRAVGRAVVGGLLRRRGTNAVVCEPDIRNERMIRFCARLGHEQVAELRLPDKVAALLVCRREDFALRWPDDLRGEPIP